MSSGDFNVAPADVDVYDPAAFAGSTHVTPDERVALRAILDAGIVDAAAHLHPGEQRFTWWDYRAGPLPSRPGVAHRPRAGARRAGRRLRECAIVRDYRKGVKPSDHAPLVVELATATG